MNDSEKYLKLLETYVNSQTKIKNVRMAAMLVYKRKIIAIESNSLKTHPFQSKFSARDDQICLHAETLVILQSIQYFWNLFVKKPKIEYDNKKLKKYFSKATLYVCRVIPTDWKKTNTRWALAKPCLGCQRCIVTFGIKTVVYTKGVDTYDVL